MPFQEKSAWACLISTLLVYVPYFALVLPEPMAYVGLFLVAVAAQAALLAAFHIVNALASRPIRLSAMTPAPDEREQRIELDAAKSAGLVLGVVVLLWCLGSLFGIPGLGVIGMAARGSEAGETPGFAIPVVEALRLVHVLFAGFVLANVCYYARIVAGHRQLGCD